MENRILSNKETLFIKFHCKLEFWKILSNIMKNHKIYQISLQIIKMIICFFPKYFNTALIVAIGSDLQGRLQVCYLGHIIRNNTISSLRDNLIAIKNCHDQRT